VGWGFRYCGHYWPIVPAPDDRWLWRNLWNEDWHGKPKYSEKTCPSATFVHHKIQHDQTRVWTRAAAVGYHEFFGHSLTCETISPFLYFVFLLYSLSFFYSFFLFLLFSAYFFLPLFFLFLLLFFCLYDVFSFFPLSFCTLSLISVRSSILLLSCFFFPYFPYILFSIAS
jgi:hypothetical protein